MTQHEAIQNLFCLTNMGLTAEEVMKITLPDTSITSVRRALTELCDKGVLYKHSYKKGSHNIKIPIYKRK